MKAEVQEFQGERCRYLVRSRTNPRTNYLVDLLENDGIGGCTCVAWQARFWPDIRRRGLKAHDEMRRCYHLNAARERFLNDVLVTMAKKEHNE
jgi:hypothetical protein